MIGSKSIQEKKEGNKQIRTQTNSKTSKISMATLRVQKDLQQYQQRSIPYVVLSFPLQSSFQTIDIRIRPQKQSVYYGTQVLFRLTFPQMYPIDAPKVKCLSKIYHPNISYTGSVCLPLLREDYSPTVNFQMVICGLIFILTYPDGDDALQPEIGDHYLKNRKQFIKNLSSTANGNYYSNKKYDNIIVDKMKFLPEYSQEQSHYSHLNQQG